MCIITEKNSTVCGHRASYTDECKKKRRGRSSILNRFAKGCSSVLNSTYNYEICHTCRRFWRDHGVSERVATESTREYRKMKDEWAPLAPETVFYSTTWADIVPDLPMYSREENASSATLWPALVELPRPEPEVLPQLPANAYLPPKTADSGRTGSETITIGMASNVANTQNFELGNVNRPLPPRPQLERPIAHFPAFQPCPAKSRSKPDLDKPLPRAPRPDSPVPGAPFDSQNPDRDLPANKYYPRFI
jgi:hypothetical protein